MKKTAIRAITGITIALSAAVALAATVGHAKEIEQSSRARATTVGVTQPRGYLIANYTIRDQQTFRKYMEAAGPLAPKFKGKVIIYDVTSRTLEGNPKSVMAVAEFPSVADAERFYNSPEYSAARTFRVASTEGSVVLAEGLPPATQVGEQSNTESTEQTRNVSSSKEGTEKFRRGWR
jgi:uncharacterized protein (DUF1330 family)